LLLALAASSSRAAADRVVLDLGRVKRKIVDLAGAEPGEPLPITRVHTAEVRRVVAATNRLLERLTDMKLRRFVATEQALEAERLKSEFFAHMSHDLRSPLTSILGFAELLEREIEGPLSPEHRAAMGRVRARGEHVLRLVSEILDWARVSAGGLELHLTWTPAVELLQQAAREANARATSSRAPVEADPAAGLPQILIDRPRAAAAVAALAAMVAAHAGGEARLILKAREVDQAPLGRALTIAIEGPARLTADTARGSLEPFCAWSDDALGLRIPFARRVIELHGGRIDVLGPEESASFAITLPLGRAMRRTPPARA
jgi:two-component system cell cycle sensor histidine kinase PleC